MKSNDPVYQSRLTRRATESGRSGKLTCASCLDDFGPTEVVLVSCNEHHWCKDCILAYFQHVLEDMSIFPPRCCNERIRLRDVYTSLPTNVQKIYSDKWLEHSTPDKEKVYCANAQCSIFLFPEDIRQGKATCPKCKTTACLKCKGKYHQGKCSTSTDIDLQKVIDLAKKKGWQKCPKCGHMVEKKRGCDHIYVSLLSKVSQNFNCLVTDSEKCRCGRDFCYSCGEEWSKRIGGCVKSCDTIGGIGRLGIRDDIDNYHTAIPGLTQPASGYSDPRTRRILIDNHCNSYLYARGSPLPTLTGHPNNISRNLGGFSIPSPHLFMSRKEMIEGDGSRQHGLETQPSQAPFGRQQTYLPPATFRSQLSPFQSQLRTRRQPVGSLRRSNFNDIDLPNISQNQYFDEDLEDMRTFRREWEAWERSARK